MLDGDVVDTAHVKVDFPILGNVSIIDFSLFPCPWTATLRFTVKKQILISK
jgi:hypothetical protein